MLSNADNGNERKCNLGQMDYHIFNSITVRGGTLTIKNLINAQLYCSYSFSSFTFCLIENKQISFYVIIYAKYLIA